MTAVSTDLVPNETLPAPAERNSLRRARLRLVPTGTTTGQRKRREKKKINFEGATWHAVADDAELLDAQNPDLEAFIRIRAYARCRMDCSGHAQFKRGELMKLLGVTKFGLRDAMKKAVQVGWIKQESTTTCLVSSYWKVQRGGRAVKPCPVHD